MLTESDLRPFQRRFLRAAFQPGIEIAALSCPRGAGKSTLAGHLVTRALTPGDALFVPGAANVLLAGGMKQARIVFRLARAALGEVGYRFEDSATRASRRCTSRPERGWTCRPRTRRRRSASSAPG